MMTRLSRAAATSVMAPDARGATMPLSPAQRRAWLDIALAPHAASYDDTIAIEWRGVFDRSALEAAIYELVRRHAMFRTSFAFEAAGPARIVHATASLSLTISDVRHLPEAEHAGAAIASDAAGLPIDIAVAPLVRACLVRVADDVQRLDLTIHHILFEGVAFYRTLLDELARLYTARTARPPAPQPAPAPPRHHRAPAAGDPEKLARWRRILADAPPRFDLVGDRPRPALPTCAGSMERFRIAQPLCAALSRLAGDCGASLRVVLLAAFITMLHRRSGEQDIVIGGVGPAGAGGGTVGDAPETFALRAAPSPDTPFAVYLTQIAAMAADVLDASELPFDHVLRALDLRSGASRHPLYSILFSIFPPALPSPTGWELVRMDIAVGWASFDLHLELDDAAQGLAARIAYSTELFDRTTIRRMIGQWLTMLQAIAIAPETPLGALPLMTADDAARTARWNATDRAAPALGLPAMIAAQVLRTPDAPALRHAGQSWTYRDLDRRAGQFAAGIADAGIGRGSLVAIALDRSPELVAGLLGIWRAGAAYLPLDAGQPRARIARIIDDSDPDLLLTTTGLRDALPIGNRPVLLVEGCMDLAPRAAVPTLGAHELAYVIYTSGSTGLPKGVEIEHGALANFIRAMRERPGFAAGDSLLAVTAVTFDIAALELFLPLASGGRVVIAPSETTRDPMRLMALIAAEKPDMIQATPALWLALLEAGWRGDPGLTALCGGEAMARTLADRLIERCAVVWNMYGPTEATIWATAARIRRGEWPIAIGQPIANMTAHVLDTADRPVPREIVGELYLGGAGLARGYRGQEALTRDRFRSIAGRTLYRTGDLARRRADGALVWLGRADSEEKIRGYRIAVEEVEGALAALPGIAAAAVRGWPDASGVRTLAAYVVPEGGTPPDIPIVRQQLATILPDYMVPGRFVLLDALPLTASGKIDRGALGAPGAPLAVRTAPFGPDEQRLATLWRDVLGVRHFDRTDSFFDLGGHSLLAVHLLGRIEAEYGRRIDMAELFRVERFDTMVTALAAPPLDASPIVPIQPHGSQPPLFWIDAGPAQIELARLLGADQPFLGLAIDTMIDAAPERSIQGHARELVRRLRIIQPHGPYLIGGWCTAGILAFEVARQLCAAGLAVPLLIMGDAVDPSWRGDPLRRVGYHLRRLAAGPNEGRVRYLWGQARKTLGWGVTRPQRQFDASEAVIDDAALYYRPRCYRGNVLLFRSSDWNDRLGQGGWPRQIRGDIADHVYPGDHETFFHPGVVDAFAAALRAALEKLANA